MNWMLMLLLAGIIAGACLMAAAMVAYTEWRERRVSVGKATVEMLAILFGVAILIIGLVPVTP